MGKETVKIKGWIQKMQFLKNDSLGTECGVLLEEGVVGIGSLEIQN